MTASGRPTYSPGGFLRKMQMVEARVWVLVEGAFDRGFYSHIIARTDRVSNETYRVVFPSELFSVKGDGKQMLLGLYRYLRIRKALISTLGGKKTAVLFFVDKDIDNLEGTKARSRHVVYTEYYCAENYAVRFGNLPRALSAATSLDISEVIRRTGCDSEAWCLRAAENWRAWIEYCVLVRRLRITGTPNYRRRKSPIHPAPYGECDVEQEKTLLAEAKRKSGLSTREFAERLAIVKTCVGRMFREGKHDSIFKGSWYVGFMIEDAKQIAAGRSYGRSGLENRVIPCLVATVAFSGHWVGRFQNAIEDVIKMIGPNE